MLNQTGDTATLLEVALASDVGRLRQNNEDAVAENRALGLILLADGMGGYNAGEIASSMAISEILNALQTAPSAPPLSTAQRLEQAILGAHDKIYALSQTDPACAGMGTTLVAAVFEGEQVCVAHVGDSRLYRLRDGELSCLTRDHSLLEEMIARGQLSRDDAHEFVKKNVVTRALGVEAGTEVEINEWSTAVGDIYLACSDGLNDMISDEAIARRLQQGRQGLMQDLAQALINDALAAGGRDNVSVVLARINDGITAKGSWFRRLFDWI